MKQFLSYGDVAIGAWCAVGDPFVVEIAAACKPDYVCLDMQHGAVHDGNLLPLLQAVAAGGSVPLVRVAECNPALIMKALDYGAKGIIVPLVETAEQAARAVEACRYPPAGRRSFGPFRAALHAASNNPSDLEQVACIVMIETQAGIENVEEIVAVEGVTAAYIGPSDFSLAIGLPPGSIDAPEFMEAIETVKAACKRHHVVVGIHCAEGSVAVRFIEEGFGMVTAAVDMPLLRKAIAASLSTAAWAAADLQSEA